jgi:hypothetical protein
MVHMVHGASGKNRAKKMNVLKNLIQTGKQPPISRVENQNRTETGSAPLMAESGGVLVQPLQPQQLTTPPSVAWPEIPPPVLSVDERLSIDSPSPCPRCRSLDLWEAPESPAGFVWRCRRCDPPRRAKAWLVKRERVMVARSTRRGGGSSEPVAASSGATVSSQFILALDSLVAGANHLKGKYGIGIAEIDGQIRVTDPRGCLSPTIRDWLKAAIHACWPDGRYT